MVYDSYRWLEDIESKATKEFIKSQNEVTRNYIDGCIYKNEISLILRKIWDFPKVSVPSKQGQYYFQFRNTGLQNQSVLYIMNNLEDVGNVFLDPNKFSSDGTVALANNVFSEDGKTFAYGLSRNGSDWMEIRFRDVDSGEDYPEYLEYVKFSYMSWMHDNKGFFYAGYLDDAIRKKHRKDGTEITNYSKHKLYYHKLGTNQSEDIVVVEFEDPQLMVGAEVSDCGNYLVVFTFKDPKFNLIHYALMPKKIKSKLSLTVIVKKFEAGYMYVTNYGPKFYFQTNKNAPNYKIISINFERPEPKHWKDVIPEHPANVLEWAKAINRKYLVVCYLQDCRNILQLFDVKNAIKTYVFEFGMGTITAISGRKEHSRMFFSFSSFLVPNNIYRVDFKKDGTIVQRLTHETRIEGHNPDDYIVKQEFCQSRDGTKIPMFIVHLKEFNHDATRPAFLYAYGGFCSSTTPYFSISRLVFMKHFKGTFAIANIRGGGEYGVNWHVDGILDKKQNSFDDFKAAARYLVQNKYTNPKKLIINGRSNGGLVVAACLNQSPELFGAVICQVGVLDMLRFHKFTIGYGWKSDYGNPEDRNQFKHIFRYSPLHNIRHKDGVQYPATLLLTADHDDRVVPLHSYKFIAQLQNKIGSLSTQTNPLMIRIETRAGHGNGKPTTKVIEEYIDIFCFISRALNLPFYPDS